jgi:hypothetical protein
MGGWREARLTELATPHPVPPRNPGLPGLLRGVAKSASGFGGRATPELRVARNLGGV